VDFDSRCFGQFAHLICECRASHHAVSRQKLPDFEAPNRTHLQLTTSTVAAGPSCVAVEVSMSFIGWLRATPKISTAEFHENFGRRVVVLNEAKEAAELLQALARPCRTPEAVALDHLIDHGAR
jgi:hypothetical protein